MLLLKWVLEVAQPKQETPTAKDKAVTVLLPA
jgi:hypothetical protein